MATPSLTKHTLPGRLGDILIDVRAAGRGSPRPAVVIVHGFKGFKDWGMFPPLAERLALAGFGAVSFNASGSGVDGSGEFVWPERFGRNTFSAELADLARVLDALESGALETAAPTSIGLIGHSRGGGMALLQAACDARVRALVTWAGISTVDRWTSADEVAGWRERGRLDVVNTRTGQVLPLYPDVLDDVAANKDGPLDIQRAAALLDRPWLLIHGTGDTSVSVTEADRLAQAAKPPGFRKILLEGAGHTFGAAHPWKGSTPELDTAISETVGWFSRHLS
jgi:dienelactone hydrolase